MTADPNADTPPADEGLDRRRIRASVLDYQSAARRRRLPLIATIASFICGADGILMAGQLARPHPLAAALVGICALVCLTCAVLMWRRLRSVTATLPIPAAQTPPDFTGLGGGPSLAEKLSHIRDDPE